MIAYRDLLGLALEKDPMEKARLASQAFLSTTVFTGLAVTYRRGEDRDHRLLFAEGYREEALVYLRDSFIVADPWYRRAVSHGGVLTWRGSQVARGEAVRSWLLPAGFRSGLSLPIEHAELGEIGSVHVNSTVTDFGDQQFDAAQMLARFVTLMLEQREAQTRARLTERERQVVALIAEGASNPEIAETLWVSRRTVATHVENILPKLGVRSRVGIAVEATRLGLV